MEVKLHICCCHIAVVILLLSFAVGMHELHQLCGLLLVEDRGAPGNFVLASEKVLLPDDYSITLLIQRKLWINQKISAAQTF